MDNPIHTHPIHAPCSCSPWIPEIVQVECYGWTSIYYGIISTYTGGSNGVSSRGPDGVPSRGPDEVSYGGSDEVFIHCKWSWSHLGIIAQINYACCNDKLDELNGVFFKFHLGDQIKIRNAFYDQMSKSKTWTLI